MFGFSFGDIATMMMKHQMPAMRPTAPRPGFGKRSDVQYRAARQKAEITRSTRQLRRNSWRLGESLEALEAAPVALQAI